jgi:hypothetical protein
MADEITGISLRDVRKLLERQSADTRVLNAVSGLLDAAILLSPAYAGPDGAAALLGLFEAKNALVSLGREAIERFAKPPPEDYLAQATRLATANCLLTYTAYFDALLGSMPDLMKLVKLSDKDKARVKRARERRMDLQSPVREVFGSGGSHEVADLMISVPHPADPDGGSGARMALYEVMGVQLLGILSTHDKFWGPLSGDAQTHIHVVVREDVPALANRIYQESLVGLADDYPQFLTWLLLSDQEMKTQLLGRITAQLQQASHDARLQFGLVGRAVDLGLKDLAEQIDGLRRALAALNERPVDRPAAAGGHNVAADLHFRYAGSIWKPIIEDRSGPFSGPRLVYPTMVDAYVPQAYRLIRYTSTTAHLEQDAAWGDRPVANDLGPFLLRYLESAYSTRTPLLILGHPGSGKSLLTQVLAARLAYPAYTTVRVKLRDVSSAPDIQRQVEQQIHDDTGEDVSWPQFTRSLPTPPVVILDGYDELLQATGSTQADYLDRVRQFQDREAELGRPVRVIVTSRITLIDKVSIPSGTTIVRLEEFDEPRRRAWTTVWNDHNRGYFAQAGVHEFQLPDNPRLTELAGQPLLLLMLAIYDSAANQLRNSPDIDQTRLYHELITRFIGRELEKDAEGFSKLPPDEQKMWVARELERLGVAAIGMFNRQAVAVRREDLNRDLAFFKAERTMLAAGPRPLSQAELLVGSFLFIHESRSRSEEDPGDPSVGPATYEFLHKTFGEFLTADFLLAQVFAQAKTVLELANSAALVELLPERLSRLNPNWFGCLVHTPLHTQPNVLLMLREWVLDRPSDGMPARPELIAALDRIVDAQLRGLLAATTLPALAPQDRDTPYAPLPALGHLATYTLNLVLLRAYLCDDSYLLDESDLGDQHNGSRPWDRLTALWRSWFAPESLAALASRMTATRTGTRITIVPSSSPLAATETTALATAYNASLALADDLTTASLGLHLASVSSVPDTFIDSLRERIKSEALDLIPVIDFVAARTSRRPIAELPAPFDANISFEASIGYLPHGLAVERAEMAYRLCRSPASRAMMNVRVGHPIELVSLSRYAAEVAINCHITATPEWLLRAVEMLTVEDWCALLGSPAAAPVLRAVRQQFTSFPDWLHGRIGQAFDGQAASLFDIDTAAGVAILAWRGGDAALCSRAIDCITRAAKQGVWRLFDIPVELWGDLTDLLVSATPESMQNRPEFAELMFREMDDFPTLPIPHHIELRVATLRIGMGEGRETASHLAEDCARYLEWGMDYDRRIFLLLVRRARDNSDRDGLRYLFSRETTDDQLWKRALGVPREQTLETVNVEAICMSLSYREALDLRWALDIARQELPDQDATPQPSSPPRRPRKPRLGSGQP